MKKIVNTSKIALILLVLASTSGCIKTVKTIGYSPETDKFKELIPGKTRKAIVKRELGSPTTVSTYGRETWYYITSEQEYVAFLRPKVKSQKVVEIQFADDETISNVTTYDTADARDIKISKDSTKTEGNEDGVLRQLLGNIGRFNNSKKDAAAIPTPGR